MLKPKLPGKRKRGRPKRFMDIVREDMQVVGMTEEDSDKNRWKWIVCCGDL